MHISQGSITDFNYLQIPGSDQENDPTSPKTNHDTQSIPSSPPPSFRSRASSQSSRRLLSDDPITTEADRTLADTFDDGSASDSDGNEGSDDRQRLMRGNIPVTSGQTIVTEGSRPVPIQRTVTEFPGVLPSPARTRGTPYSTFATSNDGVFANLSAKPERGEKDEEEKPPVSVFKLHLTCLQPLTLLSSLMKLPPPMPLPHIGKPPSSLLASPPPMKSTSTASQSAPFSASSGTA